MLMATIAFPEDYDDGDGHGDDDEINGGSDS